LREQRARFCCARHESGAACWSRDYFESERSKRQSVLAFSGLSLGEDGRLRGVTAARTLTEAEATAGALRKALIERKVHPDVLKFCRAELVVDNYTNSAPARILSASQD
jgi:hypothetical protein